MEEIGSPPWSRTEILESIDEFERLYEQRPIQDNAGGMKAPHMFATWFMARHLSPANIIESGIWKGQSTWLLEQACPKAKIFSIDLNLSKRSYISASADYFETDFSEVDWSMLDPTSVLVFFDDHQNAYSRLQQCRWFGFKDVIFEDNYPGNQGDFYSLKAAFSGTGFGAPSGASSARKYTSLPARVQRKLAAIALKLGRKGVMPIPQFTRSQIPPNRHDAHFLRTHLKVYYEFPPVYQRSPMNIPAPDPILSCDAREEHRLLWNEAGSYNWICYARLK